MQMGGPTLIARLLFLVSLCCPFAPAAASGDDRAQSTRAHYLEQASQGIGKLQTWYSPATGLYETTGWWNAGNAITVLADALALRPSAADAEVLANTFVAAQTTSPGFINQYYDDEGWWALAWIRSYDVTHEPRYLAMAQSIFKNMSGGWNDSVCGGGLWWSKDRAYKNAIANELFLSVAAHLANRVSDPGLKASYLSWANREWKWFRSSGMMNAEGLINDGLVSTQPNACVNNRRNTWTYNQGVILGALTELSAVDRDPAMLSAAHAIADAALHHLTDSSGILHDTCEPDCGADALQFKGIFMRNLAELYTASPQPAYRVFVDRNADSLWKNAQGDDHAFGEVWTARSYEAMPASRRQHSMHSWQQHR